MIYFSVNGDEDSYKILPFKLPNQHIYDFLNGLYKETVMDTLKDCSNFPVFEGKCPTPLEKRSYTMDKCRFSSDGFPSHLKEGFYKVAITAKGQLGFEITTVCKVEINR